MLEMSNTAQAAKPWTGQQASPEDEWEALWKHQGLHQELEKWDFLWISPAAIMEPTLSKLRPTLIKIQAILAPIQSEIT